MYQVSAYGKFSLKIARTQGFPYVSKKLCNPKDKTKMEDCLEDFRTSEDKGEQLANKIMAITEQPCFECILFVKVYAQEESQISIHAQSSYAEVEIKEGQPLTDTVDANQSNRYGLTRNKNRETILNIHVISGKIQAQLYDYESLSLTQNNEKGDKNIHIVIPSKDTSA